MESVLSLGKARLTATYQMYCGLMLRLWECNWTRIRRTTTGAALLRTNERHLSWRIFIVARLSSHSEANLIHCCHMFQNFQTQVHDHKHRTLPRIGHCQLDCTAQQQRVTSLISHSHLAGVLIKRDFVCGTVKTEAFERHQHAPDQGLVDCTPPNGGKICARGGLEAL